MSANQFIVKVQISVVRMDSIITQACGMIRLCGALAIAMLFAPSHGLVAETEKHAAEGHPNIMIILADDLGFSDLGCYGGEIQTPVLDSLAASGLRLTNFYNTGRCWPTRASLLTGYYAQQIGRDRLPGIKRGGARNQRPNWAQLLPQILQKYDYRTYHSGKWHIDGTPLQGGFDRSYWTPDHGRYFSPKRHLEDDVRLPPVARGNGYYATTATANHAVRCLQEHAEQHPDQPFFSYVAFIAPHFPLHALPQDIARYDGTYQAGWEVIRQQRWARIHKMRIVDGPLSKVERGIGPPYHFPNALEALGPHEVNRPVAWNELTRAQREFQSKKMAIHAAMVHRMDIEIGRIVQQLKEMDMLDNTLIMFLSDNGASAEIMVRDDGHDPHAIPGSADTHLCLGPGWSTVSNTPFRRHKTWVHEGGIATPCIVHWPDGITPRGELCSQLSHVIDLVPSVLDALAGENGPTQQTGNQDENAPVLPGRSLLPVLRNNKTASQNEPAMYWWLHEGNRAIRRGHWKLVSAKDEPWELYDLSVDRNETSNLASSRPDLVDQLSRMWQKKVDEFTVQARKDYGDETE